MSVCALTSLDVNKFASTVFAAPPPSRPSSVRQHQVSSISFGNNDDARIEAYRSHQRVEPTTFRPEVRPNRAEAAAVEESLAWSRCLDCCFLYRSACRTTERTTTDHRSCLDRNRHADFLRAANTATEVQLTLQWTRSSSRALLSGRKPAPAPAVQSASDTSSLAVPLRCAQGRQICGFAVWSESRPQRVVWGLPQCQAPREGPWGARLRPSPRSPHEPRL